MRMVTNGREQIFFLVTKGEGRGANEGWNNTQSLRCCYINKRRRRRRVGKITWISQFYVRKSKSCLTPATLARASHVSPSQGARLQSVPNKRSVRSCESWQQGFFIDKYTPAGISATSLTSSESPAVDCRPGGRHRLGCGIWGECSCFTIPVC